MRIVTLLVALVSVVAGQIAMAANARAIGLIRDAEVEDIIAGYAAPIFGAAGLGSGVKIYIVNDHSLNAFVAGGRNLFINTGLIMRSGSSDEIIGVIAHEAGHIAGGHLARLHGELGRANAIAILSAVLGGIAAASTGQGGAAGIGAAGQQTARNLLLRYTQTQESAADQAALRYLDATGQSAAGLLRILERLKDQEIASGLSNVSPMARSHPLTESRIDVMRRHVGRSSHGIGIAGSSGDQRRHDRMVAKLQGFLDHPNRTLSRYGEGERSVPGRYARAIALHRMGLHDDAVAIMDSLIREQPGDAYFHELKGQILMEAGRISDSVGPYRQAVRLMPSEPLIQAGLARSLLALEDQGATQEALSLLIQSTRRDRDFAEGWRQLAIAYGRLGDTGNSALALAEQAMAQGSQAAAREQARRAMHHLPEGSPSWVRAQDIDRAAR